VLLEIMAPLAGLPLVMGTMWIVICRTCKAKQRFESRWGRHRLNL
jgi:hypothetical protein